MKRRGSCLLEEYGDQRLALDLKVEVHTRADRLSVAYRRSLAQFVRAAGG